MDQRLNGLESLLRKRIDVHLRSHEDKLQQVIESGDEFRLSVNKQIQQLDDAILYPQVQSLIIAHNNRKDVQDYVTHNETKQYKARIQQMLRSIPDGASEDHRALWRKIKPLSVEQLERFWRKVEPNNPLFSNSNLEYQKWKSNGIVNYGMRDKTTGLAYGIVRQVKPSGWIHESTFKDGKLHGLSR